MHNFNHYFVTIFPKYWHIQGTCCATHCTETGKTPTSAWEDCRLDRMQDSASACRQGSTRKQWDGANHHKMQCFQFTSCQMCTRFREIVAKIISKKKSFLVHVKKLYINSFFYQSHLPDPAHIFWNTVICIF